MRARTVRRPAAVVAAFYAAVVLALLATHAWDARLFATTGPQWRRHDPSGTRHGDGRAYHDFAVDPAGTAREYDRMRTARILYPMLARGLALGRTELVPWALLAINVAAIVGGTEIVHRLLAARGLPVWAALGYGAWAGLGLALLHGTAEPLAYLCALAGILWLERRRLVLGALACLGALLTRETALLVIGPYLVLARDAAGRPAWRLALGVLAAWGSWLVAVRFIGVGHALPPHLTPRLPLTGFQATRLLDLPVTVIHVVAPAVAALALAGRALREHVRDAALWAVALNALFVLCLPPNSARMLWHSARLSTGLVAGVLVAAALARPAPRAWRALAALFATSALWTAAVTARYVMWDAWAW